MGLLSKLQKAAPKLGGMGSGKGMGAVGMAMLNSKSKGVAPDATKKPRARGPIGKLLEVSAVKEKMFKKGGAVKKSSDAAGRAMGRKTADAKGRAMKKGK